MPLVQLLGVYMENLDRIVVPKDTVIHIGGLPFQLEQDTTVLGRESNYNLVSTPLAQDMRGHCCQTRTQGTDVPASIPVTWGTPPTI
jgi:hypothetical protein